MKKLRYGFDLVAMTLLVGLSTYVYAGENSLSNKLYIAAVNPGYSSNTGEMIEIKNISDDDSLSLAGTSLLYVDSNGVTYTLYEFDDGDEMIGESLLFRYKKAPDATEGTYDLVYSSRSLLQNGGVLKIIQNESLVDQLCWGEVDDCATPKFTSSGKKTLVRSFDKLGTDNEFSFASDYVPTFDSEHKSIISTNIPEEKFSQCKDLRFSEILTYYESSKSEQFIELFNSGDEQIQLDGCSIKYKNKFYDLTGIVKAGEYFVRYATDFSLTKNPTSENRIDLIDADGALVDSLTYYNGQKKSVAYAQFGYDKSGKEQWMQTYKATPGEENVYQKWKTCPEGKAINEETGNCVKVTTNDTTLEACPEGKYRNPLTNRCKSYATEASNELKPCADGYERNPETNRCRKITTNTGADYALAQGAYEEKSNFVAIWAIVGVVTLGVGYIVFQYRQEIAKIFRKKQ